MPTPHFAVVAPCFNEGEVAVRFLAELEQVLARCTARFTVVLVDDGSTDDTLALLRTYRSTSPSVNVRVISLAYNMGHQEAIHQGLLYASTTDAEHFIVMDSDGEDDPGAIVELITLTGAPVVFVARGRRWESIGFKLGYWFYRKLFKIIAGRSISFGNYSMIDRRLLEAVLDRSFVHYAAFLSKQRVPARIIVRDRRPRAAGNTKMGFRSLSIHAFRSLVEYGEELVSLFLRGFIYLAIIFLLLILTIVGIKLFTPYAIPGWASVLSVSLFNALLICLGFFSIGLLLVSTAQRRERSGRHLYKVIEGT